MNMGMIRKFLKPIIYAPNPTWFHSIKHNPLKIKKNNNNFPLSLYRTYQNKKAKYYI